MINFELSEYDKKIREHKATLDEFTQDCRQHVETTKLCAPCKEARQMKTPGTTGTPI